MQLFCGAQEGEVQEPVGSRKGERAAEAGEELHGVHLVRRQAGDREEEVSAGRG